MKIITIFTLSSCCLFTLAFPVGEEVNSEMEMVSAHLSSINGNANSQPYFTGDLVVAEDNPRGSRFWRTRHGRSISLVDLYVAEDRPRGARYWRTRHGRSILEADSDGLNRPYYF